MIRIKDKSKCSGCHACFNACPKECIEMVSDREGFLYPKVDESKCVKCGKCIKACPIVTPKGKGERLEKTEAYASYTRNEEIRLQSSSGGVFTEIATLVIEEGGVVFGVSLENCIARHTMVESVDALGDFRGSKYVQSIIGDSYRKAERCLEEGRRVLFTGTPCQIGGLYSYLKKDYPNLITQDIICHGVPSPLVWSEYIKYKSVAEDSKVRKVRFRDKDKGWRAFCMRIDFENGYTYKLEHKKDSFMRSFLSDKVLRPSCYSCAFKEKVRRSDITLADFWGINNVLPEMNDDKGTSLVILNSAAGKELFDLLKSRLVSKEAELDIAIKYNPSMVKSSYCPMERGEFIKCVSKNGFKAAYDKYEKDTFIRKLRRKLYGAMRKIKK